MSVSTWFGADTFLHGGRNKTSRPIANNTRVVRLNDDRIGIRLHDTDVVVYDKDGSVTLDSGGWLTVTTKDRINGFIGDRARVYSDRGKWFIYHHGAKGERFFDGIRIAADGTVLNPPDPALEQRKAEAEAKMRKRVDRFVDAYIKQLAEGMPKPSNGDCWACLGMIGADDNDHLLGHLTERYYVPSMLWNAMKERGYRDVATTMGIFLDYKAWEEQDIMRVRREWNSNEPDKSTLADFRRALGKYLRKRLIPTVAS